MREQPRAAPAAHRAVDLVAMDQRRAAAAPRREALGRHARRPRRNPRAASSRYGQARRDQREELVLGVFAARRLGDDLLRQHVERRVVRDDGVELAAARPRAAAPRIRSGRRARPGTAAPSACRATVWPGAADALQQRGDAVRRADLADEIDVADVDARARATRSRRAPAAVRSSAASRRRAACPSTGCRDAR